jgi:hypothetical protein
MTVVARQLIDQLVEGRGEAGYDVSPPEYFVDLVNQGVPPEEAFQKVHEKTGYSAGQILRAIPGAHAQTRRLPWRVVVKINGGQFGSFSMPMDVVDEFTTARTQSIAISNVIARWVQKLGLDKMIEPKAIAQARSEAEVKRAYVSPNYPRPQIKSGPIQLDLIDS